MSKEVQCNEQNSPCHQNAITNFIYEILESSPADAEIEELRVAVQQLISANAQKDEQIEQLRHAVQAHTRESSMMRSVSAYNTAQATLTEHRDAKVNEVVSFLCYFIDL